MTGIKRAMGSNWARDRGAMSSKGAIGEHKEVKALKIYTRYSGVDDKKEKNLEGTIAFSFF